MARTETPPPAWGRQNIIVTNMNKTGNTPTCVGKTKSVRCRYDVNWKHPHLRGEDEQVTLSQILALETPPPAWGRQMSPFVAIVDLGNTPTCVGKTTVQISGREFLWKHPHLRGEDERQVHQSMQRVETPPPAWGRLSENMGMLEITRNTPTCVGKTYKYERA